MRRGALTVSLLLLVAGAFSRVLFISSTPINWDAVQFALALDHFDLHAHQPHPPGYILYVLLGRIIDLLVRNPPVSTAILSVIASAFAVVLVYGLALEIFQDKVVAASSGLLALGSPLALYYGSVGLTYVPEMLMSVAVAWAAWRTRRTPALSTVVVLGVLLALAGGIRQTSMVVLLPLCLWAVRGSSRRNIAAFGAATMLASALWLVPLLALSGGPEVYLKENSLLAQISSARTSLPAAGVEGLAYNIAFEGLALAVGLAFGVLPLGLWAFRVVRFSLKPPLKAFLCWWILPALVLFSLSHVGQYGYVLVVLPPLFMLSALSARVVAGAMRQPNGSLVVCLAVSIASAFYFLFAQGPTTASNIAANNNHWSEVRGALAALEPTRTVLIANTEWKGPFRLAGYLLPEFRAYAYGDERLTGSERGWLYSAYARSSDYLLPYPDPQSSLQLPEGTHVVVALDEESGTMISGEKGARRVSLGDGSALYILDSGPAPIKSLIIQGPTIRPIYETRMFSRTSEKEIRSHDTPGR